MINRALFSAASDEWSTPSELYRSLDAEFGFRDDACPLAGEANSLMREWESPCYVNPPYSNIRPFIEKALMEHASGKVIVMLVPSRTDTAWWHDCAMKATEIRFIRGRLRFGGNKKDAPFPSCILVFAHAKRIDS